MSKHFELDKSDLKQIDFIGKPEEIMELQRFSSLKNQKTQLLNFHKILLVLYKLETQKIINLLNDSSNEESKFATKNGML